MDDSSMTFTSLALFVLLVIMLVLFGCHFLGPRATLWLRSNKEEKIGLSQNNFFHAHGYTLHSGSEFLLSQSGSFKRFDTIDKDDNGQQHQHQQRLQRQLQQQSYAGVGLQHATTPLWNIPQGGELTSQHHQQQMRSQAATNSSAGQTKTVTFSFTRLDETPSGGTNVAMSGITSVIGVGGGSVGGNLQAAYNRTIDGPIHNGIENQQLPLVSCMKTVPPAIGMPPQQRLAASSSTAALSSTAIPRPMAKRQMSLQNANTRTTIVSGSGSGNGHSMHTRMLTRRNSSTNPFLCESAESNTESIDDLNDHIDHDHEDNEMISEPNTALKHILQSKINDDDDDDDDPLQSNRISNLSAQIQSNGNPFYCDTNHMENTHSYAPPLMRQRSQSETKMPENAGENEEPKTFSARLANASDGLFKLRAAAAAAGVHSTSTSSGGGGGGGHTNPFTGLTQRVRGPQHVLQKTISEDFLLRKMGLGHMNNGHHHNHFQQQQHHHGLGHHGNTNGNSTWSFGRSLLRQDSTRSLGRRKSSHGSFDGSSDASTASSMDGINLGQGISCESVNSDMFFTEFEGIQQQQQQQQQVMASAAYTQITGYLCVGLQYDKNSITDEGMELTVSVLEAKGLMYPFSVASLDTFVRIYLVPDQAAAMQTKVFQDSATPTYNESFNFWLKKQQGRHSLWFHLYHNGDAHTLLGEAEMEIGEMPRPITTWIPLSDSRKCNAQWGELMFSLSYLPTAERLTIVVAKARNLKMEMPVEGSDIPLPVQGVFVKVYLMNNDKKVLKKRTSLKRCDHGLIFNEAMIFSLPPPGLTTVQLRLTVFGVVSAPDHSMESVQIVTLGHVIAGSCSTGKGLRHWHQMLSSLRKPVAMWHVLRRATNQPIFTGGAEAVVAAMQCTQLLRTKRNSIF